MAVIAEVVLRGVSREQYDAVRERTGWLERTPDGGLAHLTWWEGNDCHNLDAWEDETAFAAFGEQRLAPAMADLGLDVQPEVTFHRAHEVFTPHRGVVAATPVPAPAGDNAALVRRAYAAFAAGDIPTVLGLFDAELVWTVPDGIRSGGRYLGPSGVGDFFASLPQSYAELSVTPETFIDGGDTVAVLGTHRGRTVAGTCFEIPFVHVWTWRDGRATSFTEYFDTAPLIPDLGRTTAGAATPA
jgi:ketosteroid isomerase-like protein